MAPRAYRVKLSKAAYKQLSQLDAPLIERVQKALRREAARSGTASGSRGGKSLKQVRGRHDRFYRLRVGERRVVFDLLQDERVLLVHAIVKRADLERWLRNDRRSARPGR